MAENAQDISLESVTKDFRVSLFRTKRAVDDVSFSIREGQIVGLLGPNGSGKSTIIKMILGFLKPTKGQISINGYSPEERISRSFIGYLPENPRFQKFLTATEILFYYGKLLHLSTGELKKRIEYLLDLVQLKHAAHEKTQGYSKGMVQRLAVAQSLLAQPPVLIFDEPMSGLDPLGRIKIREIIWQINSEFPSTTIFFSTHILSDAEQLCSSVLLLRKGKLTKHCTIDDLLGSDSKKFDLIFGQVNEAVTQELLRTKKAQKSPLGLVITVDGSESLYQEMKYLEGLNARIIGLSSHRRSLEEALFGESEQVRNNPSLKEQTQ